MADNLNITYCRKNEKSRGYDIRIDQYKFWLRGDFLIPQNRKGKVNTDCFMVCTGENTIPENGEAEEMGIRLIGLTPESRAQESELTDRFVEFIKNQ